MGILSIITKIFILCPFLLLGIIYLFLKKFSKKKKGIFSKAADITTILLFFSIPASLKFIWSFDIGFIVLIIASVTAIIFTTIEWRTTKEIELKPLFRKIWRFLFLVLSFTYIAIWFTALILKIIELIVK
ncbi:DUF3397 domain-containing protein [Rummeliibacillus sp. SL167]|uniref:DUF3397 domain-containing protein n=1 Tax=Rummeliibacillus sp. SL167 TaxID=2579792 RepID=UPI0011B3F72A|nr:DUF3397 domain-containing protein [Rummeliibacillus sp. SL167]